MRSLARRIFPIAVWLIFCGVAAATVLVWKSRGLYGLAGDEPNYLLYARSLWQGLGFDMTSVYSTEFAKPSLGILGLPPAGTVPTTTNTQTWTSSVGLVSFHWPGLAVAMMLPFMLLGVTATKLVMVLVSSLVVVLSWLISGEFSQRLPVRLLAVAGTCLAMPFLVAAGQIYPEIPAGLICLLGLYWLMTMNRVRSRWVKTGWLAAIVLMPWLQMKFAAPMVILLVALAIKSAGIPGRGRDRWLMPLAGGVSLALLLTFNLVVFGKLGGPYNDALALSPEALMVFLGLGVDQNQGFLMANPLFLIGMFFVPLLFAKSRLLGIAWVLVVLSILVPNALHPAWYGGGSFSGRFGWAAAVVMILPTTMGLARIGESRRWILALIAGAGMLFQVWMWIQYTFIGGMDANAFAGIDLYRKGESSWLDVYSVFYYPIQQWLPALYNVQWARGHGPNWAWGAVLVAILIAGSVFAIRGRLQRAFVIGVSVIGALAIGVSGAVSNAGSPELVYPAADLGGQTGTVLGQARVASAPRDAAGYIVLGPYLPVRSGQYEMTIEYVSSAPSDIQIGKWEIAENGSRAIVSEGPIMGTVGKSSSVSTIVSMSRPLPVTLEFRTLWSGRGTMKVEDVTISRPAG